MAKEYITEDELLKLLDEAVEKEGSQRMLASKLRVSDTYIYLVRHRKRKIGMRLLLYLGVEREATMKYYKVK